MKFCNVSQNSISNWTWKNKTALYLKNNFLSRCQYQNKKALFTDSIFWEGFGSDANKKLASIENSVYMDGSRRAWKSRNLSFFAKLRFFWSLFSMSICQLSTKKNLKSVMSFFCYLFFAASRNPLELNGEPYTTPPRIARIHKWTKMLTLYTTNFGLKWWWKVV